MYLFLIKLLLYSSINVFLMNFLCFIFVLSLLVVFFIINFNKFSLFKFIFLFSLFSFFSIIISCLGFSFFSLSKLFTKLLIFSKFSLFNDNDFLCLVPFSWFLTSKSLIDFTFIILFLFFLSFILIFWLSIFVNFLTILSKLTTILAGSGSLGIVSNSEKDSLISSFFFFFVSFIFLSSESSSICFLLLLISGLSLLICGSFIALFIILIYFNINGWL